MTTKHTPGQWIAERNYVLDKDRWMVAHCYRADCVSSDGEAEANACLIAAAPDLLAALESVEWVLANVSYNVLAYYECPWCDARKENGHADDCPRQAAIARATGRGNEGVNDD